MWWKTYPKVEEIDHVIVSNQDVDIKNTIPRLSKLGLACGIACTGIPKETKYYYREYKM
jgi:hypothetical protein